MQEIRMFIAALEITQMYTDKKIHEKNCGIVFFAILKGNAAILFKGKYIW